MITEPLAIIALVLAAILLVPMICRKIRIPSIVGFIIVGILVGPKGFGWLGGSDTIQMLGKIGMLYIMLQAGIEVDINDFRQQRTHAVLFGIYSFIMPFILGIGTSLALGFDMVTSSLLGAMYGSHTLMTYPIVSRYGIQKNPAANIAIGGTMFTITLSLLVLAIASHHGHGLAVSHPCSVFGIQLSEGWLMAGKIVLTVAVITVAFPWLAQRFFKRRSDATSGFLIVMTMMVMSAWLADWAGLEGILGAFLCGVSLNKLVPNLGPVMQRINFVGNIEARDIPEGVVDVAVTDAFTGNAILKTYEGVAGVILHELKGALMSNIVSKIGALLIKPALKGMIKTFDATEYGGAPMLGLKGLVVKTHGNSKAAEIQHALKADQRSFPKRDETGRARSRPQNSCEENRILKETEYGRRFQETVCDYCRCTWY